MNDAQLMSAIGAPEASIGNGEGLFFPDTYLFDKNTSDLDVYRRAYRLMRVRLDEAWLARAPNLPYKTPYEALIMASIIEKETGKKSDRPMVAAVFANRLRVGMPLQTDPTVIYGMGESYAGRIRKKGPADGHSLQYLHAYGAAAHADFAARRRASLQAAMNPAQTSALYFVVARRRQQHLFRQPRRSQQGRGQIHSRAINGARQIHHVRGHRRRRQDDASRPVPRAAGTEGSGHRPRGRHDARTGRHAAWRADPRNRAASEDGP